MRQDHLLLFAIRPALKHLGLFNHSGEVLLLGTAMCETSNALSYLRQVAAWTTPPTYGPALGLWQMEGATHSDLWANWLAYRPDWANKMRALVPPKYADPAVPSHELLQHSLVYAAAAARLHYYRFPDALPAAQDIEGLSQFYKKRYNTALGAATLDKAREHFTLALQVVEENLDD